MSIVLVCLLIIGGFLVFASTVKCIPVVRSYTVDEARLQWKEVTEEVFSKQVYLSAFSQYLTGWAQDSSSFYMGKHWEIRVVMTSTGNLGSAYLYPQVGGRLIANKDGVFVTPESGQYYVSFSNFGSSPATVSMKITVTAKLESVTVQVTKYEVSYVTIFESLLRRGQ
jgi:hypothetical protein